MYITLFFLVHNSIFPLTPYMIPFFIRSQTITVGFFFYTDTLYTHIYMRISYAIKVSAEKTHMLYILSTSILTLVNTCYINVFSRSWFDLQLQLTLKRVEHVLFLRNHHSRSSMRNSNQSPKFL